MRRNAIRPYVSYLRDMNHALEKIVSFSKDLSFFQFQKGGVNRDAILFNFQIIGEAVKHVPRHVQSKNKHIPWNQMAALRNDIVHEYFDPDDMIIWEIIQHNIPINIQDLQFLIQQTTQ